MNQPTQQRMDGNLEKKLHEASFIAVLYLEGKGH